MPRKRHHSRGKTNKPHRRKPSLRRAKARAAARFAFERQIAKERAIGTDPLFHHGIFFDRSASSAKWRKLSAEYDRKLAA